MELFICLDERENKNACSSADREGANAEICRALVEMLLAMNTGNTKTTINLTTFKSIKRIDNAN